MNKWFFIIVGLGLVGLLAAFNMVNTSWPAAYAETSSKPVETKPSKSTKSEVAKVYKKVIISGDYVVKLSYGKEDVILDWKELVGCHDLTIGYPDEWQLVAIYPFGMETHVYNVHFRKADGEDVLSRIDLRTLLDTKRNMWFKLHFKATDPDLVFKKQSKVQ